ncbi:hypothetical protein [Micromonospora profundi]|uniref:hypothetical protein n=1 Tax=Micromonospora profundi TaxID=1420889 RepID=UPI00365F90FD
MGERIYDDAEVEDVRTDQLTDRDLLAVGRAPGWGGFNGRPIANAGWAGWSAEWGQDAWRVERADGRAFTQPGHFKVTVVRRDLAEVAAR